jgi:hypothetical protein
MPENIRCPKCEQDITVEWRSALFGEWATCHACTKKLSKVKKLASPSMAMAVNVIDLISIIIGLGAIFVQEWLALPWALVIPVVIGGYLLMRLGRYWLLRHAEYVEEVHE